MAIIVSGTYIKFESGAVAQSDFYDEVFGTGVFPKNGSTLTVQKRTRFDNINNKIGLKGQEKTNARITITAPESGTITVSPIVSTVYVYAVGGGGGGGYPATAGTSSYFSTVVGGGGGPGAPVSFPLPAFAVGGTASGGTTNIPGSPRVLPPPPSSSPGGPSGTGAAGGFGGGPSAISGNPGGPASPGGLYGGGGGGLLYRLGLLTTVNVTGGGGGGFALHPAFPVTGGSPYPYQSGSGGAAAGPEQGFTFGNGGDGVLILEFFD